MNGSYPYDQSRLGLTLIISSVLFAVFTVGYIFYIYRYSIGQVTKIASIYFNSQKGMLFINVLRWMLYLQIGVCYFGSGKLDVFSGLGAGLGLFFWGFLAGLFVLSRAVKDKGLGALAYMLVANVLLIKISISILSKL